MTKKTTKEILASVQKEEYEEYFKTHTLAELYEHFEISEGVHYKLKAFWSIPNKTLEDVENTNLRKYGAKNPFQVEEFKTKIRATNKARYGNEVFVCTDEFKSKAKQTCNERYGVDHYTQTEEFQDKLKATSLERYGEEFYARTVTAKQHVLDLYGGASPFCRPEIREKAKQTKIDRYGSTAYNNREQAKLTCQERYGYDYYTQRPEFKAELETILAEKYDDPHYNNQAQSCETKLLKYNDPYYNNPEKAAQTNLIRYGDTSYCRAQKDEFIQKAVVTNQQKYGVDFYCQTDEAKVRNKQTCIKLYGVDNAAKNSAVIAKVDKTNLERYGVRRYAQTPEFLEKNYITKKRNKSFNSSKPEDSLFAELCQIFGNSNILRQYKDKRYPFACDFYIPPIDMFIELNLFWTHGGHPFNAESADDLATLALWASKSTDKNMYKGAVKVWTKTDPEKQNIAKINNLNYIMLYSKQEVDDFILKLKDTYSNEQ